ncbi:hypothetical protein MMC07_004257 [Pseudocyphellaria aurata]|nr:hypothetical protein [Pseudocyphellaria aurata]
MAELSISGSGRILGLRRPNETRNSVVSENKCDLTLNQEPPFCHWDTQSMCAPLFPAFRYISRKLAQRRIYIALIVTDYGQGVMPAWPIPTSTQVLLAKIVRKVCLKFHFGSSWMTALGSTSGKRSLKDFFDVNRFDPYLLHRSLVQHEVIFGGDGLTLLSVDHIYTFKHFLAVLSSINWVPLSRVVCLASCIELLHRINNLYTGRKPLRGYFLRVYNDIEISEDCLNEVCQEYDSKYGEVDPVESTPEGGADPDIITQTALPDIQSPTISVRHDNGSETEGIPIAFELPKFVAEIDSPSSGRWGSDSSTFDDRFPTVTYPHIKGVSPVPESSSKSPSISHPLRERHALCTRCWGEVATGASSDFARDTTTILGSEWESFRTIGLGLYAE